MRSWSLRSTRPATVIGCIALTAFGLTHSMATNGFVHLNLTPAVQHTASPPGTPVRVITDASGHVIVVNADRTVLSLTAVGAVLNTSTLPGTGTPVAAVMNNTGHIFIALNNGTLHHLNLSLTVLNTATVAGVPVDITAPVNGAEVYVVTGAGTVTKFNTSLTSLGSGTVTGAPTAIVADQFGVVFVATGGGTIHRLNSSLTVLSSGTVTGTPVDLAVNSTGDVIVATSGGVLHSITPSIVTLFSRTLGGTLVAVGIDEAGHIAAANAAGTVFVVNTGLSASTSTSVGGPVVSLAINLTGDIFVVGGTATVSAPAASFSASSLALGSVTAGSSGTATVDVTNNGTAALSVTSAAIANDPAGVFSVSPVGPLSVTPTMTRTFTVTMAVPAGLAADQSYNATLNIASNDLATPVKAISLSGTGVALKAKACYSATSLAFGVVNAGTTKSLPVTVTNCGTAPLTVQSAVLGTMDAVWSLTPVVPPSSTVAVGASKAFSLTLAPPAGLTADVSYSATVTITTNDQVNPPVVTIPAGGTGHLPVARIQILPAYFDIDYRDVELGYHFSRPLLISNVGDLALTFQVSYLDPADPDRPHFALETDAGSFTIPAMSDKIFKQTFQPTGTGLKDVVIRIHNSNDATFTSQNVTLHGNGTPPVPIDAVLVLDRSGSMAGTAGEIVKIEALRRAGILFTELLRDGVDFLGLTKYDDQNSNIVNLGPIATTRATAQARLSETNDPGGIKPRGTTGIGGAMRTASDQFAASDPSHRKVMAVLTDGEENETPWIREVLNGYGSYPGLFVEHPDLLTYSIGLGVAANVNVDRLQEISNRGPGGSYQVTGDLTGLSVFNLENFYFKVFADAIGQAIVLDPTYNVALGDWLDVPVGIITEDREALFFFIGELPEAAYTFELIDPNGQVISSSASIGGMSVQVKKVNNWSFFRVKFPPADVSTEYVGSWIFRVRLANLPPVTGVATHKPATPAFGANGMHRMSVMASVGSSYKLSVSVGPGVVQVGGPIHMRAALADGGWPAPNATVDVTIKRPDGALVAATLVDDGAHGDDASGDGVFGGDYLGTSPGGLYEFHFRSQGHTARGEAVQREASRNQFVGTPKADPPPAPCIPCIWVRVLLILLLILLILLVWWIRRVRVG